jgi:hypothetical protein
MPAFSLTLAVFGIWTVFGWSLVSALGSGRNLIRNALLAPVTGAAMVMLGLFECNRWGLAVSRCAWSVTLLGCALSAFLIWRFHVPVPWRRLAPFAAVIAAGALLVGYPMLLHGFDWFSYGNDDMTNYVLGADGFLTHGFLSPFDPNALAEGRALSEIFWLPASLSGIRHGCELTLAWLMSLTGLSGHQIFMPLIVAFHLSLVAAAGALVVRGRKSRLAGLVTCAVTALSSLVTLGTMSQLIAQTIGIALLAGAGTLLLESVREARWRTIAKRSALTAVLCSALCVGYPEVLPFLAGAFGLAHTLALWRRSETLASLARSVACALVGIVLLLNNFADSFLGFLLFQIKTGLHRYGDVGELFPYYLVPSGLATYWGFTALAQPLVRPLMDLAIAGGAILLIGAGAAAMWQAWRGQPVAMFAVVMLALGISLAWSGTQFGMYKLAMYSQPFVLGSLVTAWLGARELAPGAAKWSLSAWNIRARLLPLVILAALGLRAQLYYVQVSAERAGTHSGLLEVPGASSHHLSSESRALAHAPHRELVVSDTSNFVVSKLESANFAPAQQEFPSQDYHSGMAIYWSFSPTVRWLSEFHHPGYIAEVQEAFRRWDEVQHPAVFDMHGGPESGFVQPPGRTGEDGYSVLDSGSYLSVLNRRPSSDAPADGMLAMRESEQVRNHLIQIDSDLGKNYYLAGIAREQGRVAIFQMEPDYFYPGQTMSGIGRVILFEVLHPSRGMRIQMEYTASLNADGRNQIPPVDAVDRQRVPFGAIGRGSARLFSPPLEPQTIAGREYVAIDMGADGQAFRERRTGLMRWFGASIPLDNRKITGFVRDISAISDEQYENLQPPVNIARFPQDLASKDLEYSGIYEDGWVGENSFVRLRQPAGSGQLMVRAEVPLLAGVPANLCVLADGNPAGCTALKTGRNELRAVLSQHTGRTRIDLRFDSATALPGRDGRMVSAHLAFVGFGETVEDREIAHFPLTIEDHWYPFEQFGGLSFRWVANDARFSIAVPHGQTGELAIDVEPGPGMGGKPVVLTLTLPDGRTQMLRAISGRETIRLPLSLASGSNHFALHCAGGGLATPGDPRKLNFRVFGLNWTPRANSRFSSAKVLY